MPLAEIERLGKLLAEANAKRERAVSQAQLTRSGYGHVISNIGSFDEDVYKIGMTRRLDPHDRVDELGDASVPFPFDVHAMIFTQDAPGLERSNAEPLNLFLDAVNNPSDLTVTITELFVVV